MEIGMAVSFVFEDEDWIKKLLFGTLISLIPVFGQFAMMGYTVAVIRNVMAGDPRPLPEFQNLGQFFMDGLMLAVALLVYTIPIWLFACVIGGATAIPLVAAENEDLMAIAATLMAIVQAVCGCLIALYGILVGLLIPTVHIRYAETGEIGACLQFQEVFQFTFANVGPIFISLLVVWVANMFVVSTVGGLTLGLLAIPAAVWVSYFTAHLYGQVGQQAGVAPLVSGSVV